MKERPLDPNIEKLVAGLYGELSDDEAAKLRDLLASDESLRAEWEALAETRSVLAGLEGAESAPSFVFLTPDAPVRRDFAAGLLDRARGFFDRWGTLPAYATAAAAVLVAGLAWSGFRVDRVDGGLAFRFGSAPVGEQAPVSPLDAAPGELAGVPEAGGGGPADPTVIPWATRDELARQEARVFETMTALLNDYGRYGRQEQSAVLEALYQNLTNRQDDAYEELRDRIEAVGLNLVLERSRSDARLRDLIGTERASDLPPAEATPVRHEKENRQ